MLGFAAFECNGSHSVMQMSARVDVFWEESRRMCFSWRAELDAAVWGKVEKDCGRSWNSVTEYCFAEKSSDVYAAQTRDNSRHRCVHRQTCAVSFSEHDVVNSEEILYLLPFYSIDDISATEIYVAITHVQILYNMLQRRYAWRQNVFFTRY